MKMRAITLLLFARAKVHWTKTTGGGENRSTVHYRAEEVYINQVVRLYGDGESSQMHPEGIHVYDFSMALPNNLPSSMEGAYGYVRYYCQATIDRPRKFDHNTKKPFTVLSILDLNTQPIDFRNSVEGQNRTSVDCCCCVSGECTALFRINKRAFVPGEPIVIYAVVENKSNTDMQGSRVSIKQYTDFYGVSNSWLSSGTPKPKQSSCFVASKEHGPIPAGKTDIWENEELIVPPLPPSQLVGCNIINISYVVKFYVNVSYGSDLKVATDLLIGTIPLHSVYTQYQGPPVYPNAPPPGEDVVTTQPGAFSQPPSAPSLPATLPPPSYEEVVTGRVPKVEEGESDYMHGDKEFAPRYTYYNWKQSGFGSPTPPSASTPSQPADPAPGASNQI